MATCNKCMAEVGCSCNLKNGLCQHCNGQSIKPTATNNN